MQACCCLLGKGWMLVRHSMLLLLVLVLVLVQKGWLNTRWGCDIAQCPLAFTISLYISA